MYNKVFERSLVEMKTMLSTIDNPFNPFEDFSSWFLFDV